MLCKLRVAQVFMNRVEDNKKFKSINNLYEALTQPGATSTLIDGRYYEVEITDVTREAVHKALLKDTPDYTQGALFFNSLGYCEWETFYSLMMLVIHTSNKK